MMKKNEAIALFGSVSELAAALGITRHAIYQWGTEIHEPRLSQIQRLADERRKKRRQPQPPTLRPTPRP